MSFLATFPEISGSLGSLHIRHDLTNYSLTVGLKNFEDWHLNTEQVQISETLIYFLQPDGEIVGIKCFSAREDQL